MATNRDRETIQITSHKLFFSKVNFADKRRKFFIRGKIFMRGKIEKRANLGSGRRKGSGWREELMGLLEFGLGEGNGPIFDSV